MNTEQLVIVIVIIVLSMAISKAPDALFKGIRRVSPYIVLGVVVLKLPEILELLEQVANTLWPALVGIIQRSSETLANMLTAISR